MQPREMFFEERDAIVATLESLSPDQWNEPSLCAGWSVRDVVGHMVAGLGISVGGVLVKASKAGFSIHKASFKLAKQTAQQPTQAMIRTFAGTTDLTGFVKLLGYAKLVPDITIHHEDIRRPLGLAPHPVPPERMQFSLSQLRKDTGPLKAKKRSQGVRFIASDVDWAEGEGPEVRGPGLSLLMAMGGRPVVYDELTGDGVAVLRNRAS